jgi:hypothetical protein
LKEAAGKEAEKLKQQESKLEVAERLKRERLLLLVSIYLLKFLEHPLPLLSNNIRVRVLTRL